MRTCTCWCKWGRKEKWGGGVEGTGFSGRDETTEGEEEVSCWALARAGSSVSVLVIGKGTTPRASLVPPFKLLSGLLKGRKKSQINVFF